MRRAPSANPSAERRIVLVRHQRTALPPGLCYGRLDAPLHPDARAALPRLASSLARHRPAQVWSSPATRCLLLARAVADAADAPLAVDDRLLELDFGAWEGLSWDAVPREALERWAADPLGFAPPGGESGAALLARVAVLATTLRQAAGTQLVVSHGGPLRVLPALLTGLTPDLLAAAPAFGSVLCLTPTTTTAPSAAPCPARPQPATPPCHPAPVVPPRGAALREAGACSRP